MRNEISEHNSSAPDGKTKFCFLFGSHIEHSLSPAIHTRWFHVNNLNCIYLPMQIQNEYQFLNMMNCLTQSQNFLGGNITLPFKNSALKLDFMRCSENVKVTQAANTVYKNSLDEWYLENTDIAGIEFSLNSLLVPNSDFEMIVLGGGGAASSVIYNGIINKYCSRIVCLTRNPVKTLQKYPFLANERKVNLYALNTESLYQWRAVKSQSMKSTLLINTLPLGMTNQNTKGVYGEENYFAMSLIQCLDKETDCYFDLIYKDTETIRFAQYKGIKCINGKLMLETQAKKSFFLWTGVLPMN
ncbi:shikimate dehydrogenase family protein [Silvanigrella aquatica]|uniref:Shikimate dehydrogenase substrate binding N-terminal domain-containing protein n=1 Tax=Silvanigrella aquatica TaxID=1915309 RepID=A0A1L4CXC4_9BACT|nr:hypothetical protein [Silvanigrella aquatica]APJ02601.1 hypothetical protein AXG55_01085 [Silvanigrella aquatica]